MQQVQVQEQELMRAAAEPERQWTQLVQELLAVERVQALERLAQERVVQALELLVAELEQELEQLDQELVADLAAELEQWDQDQVAVLEQELQGQAVDLELELQDQDQVVDQVEVLAWVQDLVQELELWDREPVAELPVLQVLVVDLVQVQPELEQAHLAL